MRSFSHITRQQNIERLKQETFDLVIIGGGINGAGVARDAAGRGLKVALVEANDFAFGTSSRSSKLIHGGVRYLENMEFGLVFEALSERAKLFEIAPHLVHPLRFQIPIYKNSRVGMFMMGLGMWLYDGLAFFRTPKMHERLNKQESVERLPQLKSESLVGSYVYSDAYMDDDRLVHETLRSANELGAVQVNYVEAVGAETDSSGNISGVRLKDKWSDGEEFVLRGTHFISTVGIWTDELAGIVLPQWKKIMRPSKGVHLTFSKSRLPMKNAVVMGAEKRIVFGIPRHEMVIVGTTDTDYQGELKDVHATAEDVDYLLGVANDYFPGAQLKKSDIIASYAGVRPLVDDGSESEGKTSREHTIINHPKNITFVAGGKYTTYRLIAKEVVDSALGYLPLARQAQLGVCRSQEPLNSKISAVQFQQAQGMAKELAAEWGRSEAFANVLVERHGLEAIENYEKLARLHGDILADDELLWLIELEYAVENTMCLSLEDFVLRRVPVFLSLPGNGRAYYESWASVFSDRLGLNSEYTHSQMEKMQRHINSELGWKSNLSD